MKCIVCDHNLSKDEISALSPECKAYPAHDECFDEFENADEFMKYAKGESNSYFSGDPSEVKDLSLANVKVPLKDVIAEMGAKFRPPEWFSIDQLKLMLPLEYIAAIGANAKLLERMVNTTTIEAARYGSFHSLENKTAALDGLTYQYSAKFQPHEKSFGFALFKNGQMVANQGSYISIHEAKCACDEAAKAQMGRLLE